MVWLGVATVTLLVAVAFLYQIRKDTIQRGKDEVIKKNQQDAIDSVSAKNAAHDRLRHDSDYADGVRERFTRRDP